MPTSKFDGAPRYMPAELVRAQVFDGAGTVELPDGPLGVAAGEALVVPEGGEPYVTGGAAFGAEHLPVADLPIFHVTRSRRSYRAVQVGGRMHVEGDFESHDADAFLRSHARVTDDGRTVLAHGAMPPDLQRRLVDARGPEAAGHARALGALRDRLARSAAMGDAAAQRQVDAYDLAGARVRDVVSDGMAAIHGAATPEGLVIDPDARTARLREGSVLETLVASTGIHPQAFVEARHMPTYGDSTLRALTRRLMAPFLGEHPLETVLVSAVQGGPHPLEDWARGGELVSEEPFPALPEMPGYVTTDARHYRRDDVDVLCYEDAAGGYAYCWPSPVAPAPGP